MVKELRRYVHTHGAPIKGNILMVLSSPSVSEQTGWPIGFWASELTHPMHEFLESGYQVTLASTEGGAVQMDTYSDPRDPSGYSAHDIISLGFLNQDSFNEQLQNTVAIHTIDSSQFDAIFLVGGQGPMYTFRNNEALHKLFVSFYESDKPSAAVCHATCLLLNARKSNGELLVNGKTWTGFADAEEQFADQAVGQKIQPYWIETEARAMKQTIFKVADPFSSFVIQDGNLITGQQQNSGAAAARLLIDYLN